MTLSVTAGLAAEFVVSDGALSSANPSAKVMPDCQLAYPALLARRALPACLSLPSAEVAGSMSGSAGSLAPALTQLTPTCTASLTASLLLRTASLSCTASTSSRYCPP